VTAGGRAMPLERGPWLEALRALPSTGAALGKAGRTAFETRWAAPAAAAAYEAVYDDVGRSSSPTGFPT